MTADPPSKSAREQEAHSNEDALIHGWILINDLGCFQCHQGKPSALASLPSYVAPELTDSSIRLNTIYFQKWLEHPQLSYPTTRMPSLLHGIPEGRRQEVSQALTAFLWQQTLTHNKPDKLLDGNIQNGETLFKSIGCAACHAPLNDPQSNNHPLHHVKEKYTAAGLVTFLSHSTDHHSSKHLPNFRLSETEVKDLTAYLTAGIQHKIQTLKANSSSIKTGREWFKTLHCQQCHSFGNNVPTAAPSHPILSQDNLKGGCLSNTPQPGIPWYDLTTEQRHQIRTALGYESDSESVSDLLNVEAYMKALRCDACHTRGRLRGPSESNKTYFTTTGEDLEDEGKVPPNLNGVGRKMKQDALLATIQGQLRVRPYMTTRMPDFGEEHARFLANAFAQTDTDPNEKPTPRNGQENQVGRNMWGRALMGINGLGCIQCHSLNGHRSLGIQAMDLIHASQRLRGPWFRDYMLNPSKFRPGTRMPAFWPEGKPSINGHGGSTERQIDSLWVYLNELDQSRLPEGMEQKGDFKLVSQDRPIVFRTFMEQAGLHAIAVGFAESYHAAFDSKSCRWTLAWKGDFLSAESTWDDRFTPLTSPLGETLDWFWTEAMAWPSATSNQKTPNGPLIFRGYQLDPAGIPTFIYTHGTNTSIRDRITSEHDGLVRQLKISSIDVRPEIPISTSKHILEHENKVFRSQNSSEFTITKGTPDLRSTSDGEQLWVTPILEDNQLIVEYRIREVLP